MNGKSVYRQVALLATFALAAAAVLLWSNRADPPAGERAAKTPPIAVSVTAVAGPDTILHRAVEATPPVTALAALEQAAAADSLSLGIREYDFGRLVVSIGGVTAGPDGDWTYTINDDHMPVGAGACLLQAGDRLVFRFGQAATDSL
jgi:hypothetical protein